MVNFVEIPEHDYPFNQEECTAEIKTLTLNVKAEKYLIRE